LSKINNFRIKLYELSILGSRGELGNIFRSRLRPSAQRIREKERKRLSKCARAYTLALARPLHVRACVCRGGCDSSCGRGRESESCSRGRKQRVGVRINISTRETLLPVSGNCVASRSSSPTLLSTSAASTLSFLPSRSYPR